jgi:hypothetical protein
VIENNGSKDALRRQVDRFLRRLAARDPSRRRGPGHGAFC